MSEERKYIPFKDIPKKDPFKVPEGYFESFPGKTVNYIEEREKGEKVRELKVNWRIIKYASAASVAVLIAFLIGYRHTPDKNTPEDFLTDISTTDLVTYLQLTELELFDIPGSTNQELDNLPLMDSVNIGPHINEEDFSQLYERYGVSADDNFMIF